MSSLILENSHAASKQRVAQTLSVIFVILLAAFYVSVWRAHDPHGSDFVAFYSGAILWEQNKPIYDQKIICELQAPLGGRLCMPFFHPPILLPLYSLVSHGNYHQSYLRWTVVLLLALALCAFPLYKITRSVVSTLALLTFVPVLFNFLHGQDSIFVLIGLLGFALLLRDGRNTLAGVALSLTTLRPTLAITLGLPLLLVNRRAFASFFVSSLALTLYSLVLVGPGGFRDLAQSLIHYGQVDPSTRPDRMYSVVGLLTWLRVSPAWAWLLFAVSVPMIGLLWRRRGLTLSTFGLALVITTFASPHLHIHDLIFLVVPLIAWPALATVIASALMMALGLSQVFTYLLMLALGLWLGDKIAIKPIRLKRRRAPETDKATRLASMITP